MSNRKLSDNKVNMVRRLLAKENSQTSIAKLVGVDRRTVYRIKNKENYVDVKWPIVNNNFENYSIVGGKVFSNIRNVFVKPVRDNTYRLTDNYGIKKTVSLGDLI